MRVGVALDTDWAPVVGNSFRRSAAECVFVRPLRGHSVEEPQSGGAAKASRSYGVARSYHLVVERDPESYYVAPVPELPGCHRQARSLDKLPQRIGEAIALYLEVEERAEEQPQSPVVMAKRDTAMTPVRPPEPSQDTQ
jgi:predicted RNase H-like HicB family nuclease